MTFLFLLALLTAQPHPSGTSVHASSPAQCGDPLGFQVLLDNLGFSPGEIDGRIGPNLHRAILAFQANAGIDSSGKPDCVTWKALTGGTKPETLVDYELTRADVQGSYLEAPIPADLVAQAKLPSLSYASVAEALAERFHASPLLIRRLNRGRRFEAGTVLRVPAVTPFDPTSKPTPDSAASDITIEVTRSSSTLRAVRADGSVALFAPVSSGSEYDPLPIGTWKVTGTSWLPPFHYSPDLFWDAEPGDEKAVIKPGPNNPVGIVWIDISVPHYGMHGTASPGLVGHAQSHGCVRLTNWDAARLASLVKPGTRVVFLE